MCPRVYISIVNVYSNNNTFDQRLTQCFVCKCCVMQINICIPFVHFLKKGALPCWVCDYIQYIRTTAGRNRTLERIVNTGCMFIQHQNLLQASVSTKVKWRLMSSNCIAYVCIYNVKNWLPQNIYLQHFSVSSCIPSHKSNKIAPCHLSSVILSLRSFQNASV